MAGVISFQSFLGLAGSDIAATGIGAEKEVGVPEARRNVLIRRDDERIARRSELFLGGNDGDGSLLKEIGTTGVFVGAVSREAFSTREGVAARHATAGVAVPANWTTPANSAAVLAAHGGGSVG